jgi:serine/threonine-protein phosphatase PGAM5
MSWRLLKKITTVSAYSVGAFSFLYVGGKDKFQLVHNSQDTYQTKSIWDSNWDFRAPTSLVKPLKDGASPEKENEHNQQLEKNTGKALRHIILIRHGQYNLKGLQDKDRYLTDLGRQQAKMTGDRLRDLQIPFDNVYFSTMTRAQETGNIILKQLGSKEGVTVSSDSMLEEGAVCEPDPPIDYWNPEPHEFFIDGSRIEAAFRKYIHRAEPSQEKDSHTLIVCHGNVIRYFVCRALQLPGSAWLRFNLHHASITWIRIDPTGRVVCKFYGDSGHLPKSHVTLS